VNQAGVPVFLVDGLLLPSLLVPPLLVVSVFRSPCTTSFGAR
jgi:hypothetical protein